MSKKPRQKKLDPRKFEPGAQSSKKKDKDWSFEDVVRSKTHRR